MYASDRVRRTVPARSRYSAASSEPDNLASVRSLCGGLRRQPNTPFDLRFSFSLLTEEALDPLGRKVRHRFETARYNPSDEHYARYQVDASPTLAPGHRLFGRYVAGLGIHLPGNPLRSRGLP